MAINIPHNWYRFIPCYSKLFLNVIELFPWNSYDMFSSIFNTCPIGHQCELPPSHCPFWLFHVSSQSFEYFQYMPYWTPMWTATFTLSILTFPRFVSVLPDKFWDVCLFVFLALQPIAFVFSQPGSGL
jgi:hypothetical protein